MSNSTHDTGKLFDQHYNGLPAIIPPDCGVHSPLYQFYNVAPIQTKTSVSPVPEHGCEPVQVARSIDHGVLKRMTEGGKAFFRSMLEPTVKHV
jgi:hypothetical protein